MTTSSASAVWEGVLRSGRGHFKADSGAFEGDYSLSGVLEKGGTPPSRISTKASCTVEKAGEGFKITRMRLEVGAGQRGDGVEGNTGITSQATSA